MNETPKVFVSIERRINLGNFNSETVTVGLSQVPFEASDELLDQMIDTAERVALRLRDDMRARVAAIRREPAGGNAAALRAAEPEMPANWREPADEFDPPYIPTEEDLRGVEITTSGGTAQDLICPSCGEPCGPSVIRGHGYCGECRSHVPETEIQVARRIVGSIDPDNTSVFARHIAIPREEDVITDLRAFGVEIPFPPEEWRDEPLSETTRGGTGGGQLMAVNAALTSLGYKGKQRHAAASVLLTTFLGMPVEVGSTKDLTKYDAHLILSWIDLADQAALNELALALGQPALVVI